MKINKVMIAGMEDSTSILGLEKLKEKFPFVEWGVLFTKNKAGRARYPSIEYINEFCNSNTGDMSAHFCGAYPREILEQGEFEELVTLNEKFNAVQLNYNFDRRQKYWKFINVLKFIRACGNINIDVILQNNKSKLTHGK